MPWDKRFRDEDVLDSALLAFWKKGYEATSMADLVAATGINRSSIYATFGDKNGLFGRALDRYCERFVTETLERIGRDNPPRAAIFAVFEEAARPPEDQPGGCLLVNAAIELAPHDAGVAAVVEARLDEIADFFRDRIKAGRSDGSLRRGLKARATARALLALYLGLRVLQRAAAPPTSLRATIQHASALLE